MHVLTKIFIVLVSLLAVLLVPLVVVYATNENNYKGRWQEEVSLKAMAQEEAKSANARLAAETTQLQIQIDELRKANQDLTLARNEAETAARLVQAQLAASNATQQTIVGDIATLKNTIEASHQLTESLVGEVRTLRSQAVALEREKVELDEANRDILSQLEVAEQARRALAEELSRLKDEHSKALTQLGMAVSQGFGKRDDVRVGIRPDRTLTATVIRVERNSGQVLAEIDAGSRDGVQKDWNLTIGSGGNFIANLRIVNVDINRATGIVTLEDKSRGLVQVGHTAHAVAGQN